ncbi:MAG TPA: GNAT family N-acetyltransferase [Terracidiphilus sp.]|jgi:ribosomal protein S18 acetylase RimI-like enzyme|nr:GNAT family N-acetyltransferase [Terracidiphilus sp.]
MITLETIRPANALVFKAVRLRALEGDPTAFGSTFAKEERLADEEWFRRSVRWSSEGAIGYIAFDRDASCGLVVCCADPNDPGRADIFSMWVDPAYRRTGVGTALIDGVKDWAAGRSIRELRLMVTSVNDRAIRFYERLGFRMSGVTGPYPNSPAIFEHEMILRLSS